VFLWQEPRDADRTGRVSLQGNHYEIDPRLAGRKVNLRFDPFDLATVQVWADGRRFDDARVHELVREHDQRVKPRPGSPVALPATGLSYLALLVRKHEAEAKTTLGRVAFRHARQGEENKTDV